MRVFYYVIVVLILAKGALTGQECDLARDSAALMQLYYATDGDNWTNNDNWGTSEPLWAWYGVETGDGGCVDILNLGNNNLSGQLPSGIGDLLNATRLLLNDNFINGEIPPEIGNLTNLIELDLYNNQFTGEIPVKIGDLTSLNYLYLGYNQLSGNIPEEISNLTQVIHVFMDHNQLDGNLPVGIGDMTSLQWLDLNNNRLDGVLPASIGNLSNLTDLYLSTNLFSGDIPEEIGDLSSLVELDLYDNQFSGSIPVEIGNLSNLKYLYLSYNNLSGEIPQEIGNLIKLEHLFLDSNELQGSIPADIGNLGNLIFLFLDSNLLNGSIPDNLGNLTQLTELHLYRNKLSGIIPVELGNLQNLVYLYGFENDLSGDLPSELGNLSKLQGFYLDRNNLSGCIPQSIIDAYCSLGYNPDSYLKGYNLSNNPVLPYEGDMQIICNGEDQVGAQCDDQNPNTENDFIHEDCTCAGTLMPVDTCRINDSIALMSLYNSTGGDNWKNNDNWGSDLPLEYWYGVHTDDQSCVTCIDMDGTDDCGNMSDNGNNLTGYLPLEIGALKHLENLNLKYNNISGTIPATISEIDSLEYIYLSDNNLSGQVPAELADITKLNGLYLDNNQLSGCIPQSILDSFCSLGYNPASYLKGYNLSNNPVLPYEGDMQTICNGEEQIGAPCDDQNPNTENDFIHNDCTCAATVILNNPCRKRDSTILMSIYQNTDGDNWKNNDNWGSAKALNDWYGIGIDTSGCVEVIYLCGNNLSGQLPSDIGYLDDLKYLYLCNNNISGNIPESIGQLYKLKTLVLSRNNLTGSIPEEIANIKPLDYIYLNNNNLSSNIPNSIGNLSNLKHLYLNNNKMTGNLPESLGQLVALTDLSVYNNNLSGEIPYTLGQLEELRRFYMQNNNFSGCIPQEILDAHCDLDFNPNPNSTNGWDGYDLTGNMLLPYKGDMQSLCAGADQTGAPCDDMDDTTVADTLNNDCACHGAVIDRTITLDNEDLLLYPNPFSDKISLIYPFTHKGNIEIYDMQGKLIFSKDIFNSSSQDIHFGENLKNGIYWVKFLTDKNVFIKKIIHQK